MATTILTKTYGDGDDKVASVKNASMRRLLSIGNTWTQIRICLRLSMSDSGASISSTPRFVVGMCSGTTNPWNNGSATTTNFVGSITNAPTVNRTSGLYQWASGNVLVAHTRVGVTENTVAGIAAGQLQLGYDGAKRTAFFLTITKGSPNYSLTAFHCVGYGAASDLSYDNFVSLAILSTPTLTSHATGGTVAIAASETPGNLDCVNVAWDRNGPSFHISDLAIVRFA